MTGDMPFTFRSAFITDRGAVRPKNEDAFFEDGAAAVWAVADGMGGHAGGARASGLIIEALEVATSGPKPDDLAGSIESAIHGVNDRIIDVAAAEFDSAMIGSTVAVLSIDGGEATCLWAGDSRIYLFRDGKLQAVTEDHSEVAQMVREGLLTAEEARTHPMSNMILRAVGSQSDVDLDRITCRIEPGDVFLLCTDGIIGVLPDREIEKALLSGPVLECPQALLKTGLDHNVSDNVTIGVVVIDGA